MKITDKDQEVLQEKGISPDTLAEQLEMLKEGFPFLKIEAAATPDNGITVVTAEMEERSVKIWDEYLSQGAKVMKMVPASGAASRMFKDLFAFLNGKSDKPNNDFIRKFFDEIEKFAFFSKLNHEVLTLYGRSIATMIHEGHYKEIISTLLENTGMGYGYLPKALLRFHKVQGATRTPIEEHLAETAQYATGKDGISHIHFTVSDEHVPLVLAKIEEIKARMEHEYGVKYDVTLSVQKPSTDTVAATKDGNPYRENEKLFFRPGGHGALIENLNDLNADIIFIKNIDNVVPDTLRSSTINFKKIIGGILVATKHTIDRYCRLLEKGTPSSAELDEMLRFMHNVLCITHDRCDEMSDEEKAAYIFGKLNRPTRVCGMVRNEGEPGGGPFLCYNPDGTVSPQILESTQIDPKDKKAVKMLKEATHFNPVDLVCSIKDYKGQKFNLPDYVDKATGFISEKSREGVEIKALELPGLWNGAMSDWNTILVEVPASTFNPVKTVNDLLRPAHLA
ncbi:MAG: DUF4301 family protein [Muribaculaceae bacterium]|nr:DUF4301 family protein [Muribaculaceae bacterium]